MVVVVVKRNWILGYAGGFDIDCERKGRVKDNSKALWPEQA